MEYLIKYSKDRESQIVISLEVFKHGKIQGVYMQQGKQ